MVKLSILGKVLLFTNFLPPRSNTAMVKLGNWKEGKKPPAFVVAISENTQNIFILVSSDTKYSYKHSFLRRIYSETFIQTP